MAAIRLQLLMRPEHRNPASVEAASRVVVTLGFEITGKGRGEPERARQRTRSSSGCSEQR